MNIRDTRSVISAFIIVIGFSSIFSLSSFLENHRVSLPESYEDEDLALQGKRLKNYSLGFEGLLADWYWMRTLQYIGDRVVKSKSEVINLSDLRPLHLKLLYPLLDNATDLDPSFIAAYSYGATVLPVVDNDAAIRLTEKGIANNPDQWRFYQYLGYIYWRSQDYAKAAEAYDNGAKIAGAPSFMELMAARMKTEGGSRDTAREMYSQMLAEAKDQQTKVTAELRLMQLDSLDEQDAANFAMKEFRSRTGRCVNGWNELLQVLRNVELPGGRSFRIDAANRIVDPSDVPYVLDKENCEIKLDTEKSKIPLN